MKHTWDLKFHYGKRKKKISSSTSLNFHRVKFQMTFFKVWSSTFKELHSLKHNSKANNLLRNYIHFNMIERESTFTLTHYPLNQEICVHLTVLFFSLKSQEVTTIIGFSPFTRSVLHFSSSLRLSCCQHCFECNM